MAVDELDELIDFLVDKRAAVKLQALDILLGLTGSPEGIDRLKTKLDKLLVFTMRLICDEQKEAAHKVLSVLVNLSQDPDVAAKMLKMNAIKRSMDYLKEGQCSQPRLLVMMMANLTVSEDGCKEILQLGQDKLEGLNVAVLLKRFVMGGVMLEAGKEDTYEHVAMILTNVTRFKQARTLLLQPGRGMLQALASQLRAPVLLRRQGAAGALRNCCMSAEEDGTLEHILSDHGVLQAMLAPISGEEPKEADAQVRESMAESFMVIASSAAGRKALWAINAPDALKKGYEYEEHPGVCRALEHAAEFFLSNSEENTAEAGLGEQGAAEGTVEGDEAEAAATAVSAEGS